MKIIKGNLGVDPYVKSMHKGAKRDERIKEWWHSQTTLEKEIYAHALYPDVPIRAFNINHLTVLYEKYSYD